jgi:hypothetical protein
MMTTRQGLAESAPDELHDASVHVCSKADQVDHLTTILPDLKLNIIFRKKTVRYMLPNDEIGTVLVACNSRDEGWQVR